MDRDRGGAEPQRSALGQLLSSLCQSHLVSARQMLSNNSHTQPPSQPQHSPTIIFNNNNYSPRNQPLPPPPPPAGDVVTKPQLSNSERLRLILASKPQPATTSTNSTNTTLGLPILPQAPLPQQSTLPQQLTSNTTLITTTKIKKQYRSESASQISDQIIQKPAEQTFTLNKPPTTPNTEVIGSPSGELINVKSVGTTPTFSAQSTPSTTGAPRSGSVRSVHSMPSVVENANVACVTAGIPTVSPPLGDVIETSHAALASATAFCTSPRDLVAGKIKRPIAQHLLGESSPLLPPQEGSRRRPILMGSVNVHIVPSSPTLCNPPGIFPSSATAAGSPTRRTPSLTREHINSSAASATDSVFPKAIYGTETIPLSTTSPYTPSQQHTVENLNVQVPAILSSLVSGGFPHPAPSDTRSLNSPEGLGAFTPLSASHHHRVLSREGPLNFSEANRSKSNPTLPISGSGTDTIFSTNSLNVWGCSLKSEVSLRPYCTSPATPKDGVDGHHSIGKDPHLNRFPTDAKMGPDHEVTVVEGGGIPKLMPAPPSPVTSLTSVVAALRVIKSSSTSSKPSSVPSTSADSATLDTAPGRIRPMKDAFGSGSQECNLTYPSFTDYLYDQLKAAESASLTANRKRKSDRWLLEAAVRAKTLVASPKALMIEEFIDRCELDFTKQVPLELALSSWVVKLPFYRQHPFRKDGGGVVVATQPNSLLTQSSVSSRPQSSTGLSSSVAKPREGSFFTAPSSQNTGTVEDFALVRPLPLGLGDKEATREAQNTSTHIIVELPPTSPSSTHQQRSHLASFTSKDNADESSQSSAPLSRPYTRGAATDMGDVSATTIQSSGATKSVLRQRSFTPRDFSSRSLSESFNVSKSDPIKPDLTLFYPKAPFPTRYATTSHHSQSLPEGGGSPYASNTGLPQEAIMARSWSGSSKRTPAHSRTMQGDQSAWASVVSAQTCPDSPTRSAPWVFPNTSLHSAPHSTGSVSAPPKTSSSCTSPTDPSGGGSPAVDGVGVRGTPTGWRSRLIHTGNTSSLTAGDYFSQLSADSRTASFEAAATRSRVVISPTSSGAPLHVVSTIMGAEAPHRTNPLTMMTPPYIHHADGSISDELLEDPRQNQGHDRTHRSSDSLKMSSLQSGLYPSQISEDHSSSNNHDITSPTSRYNHHHLPGGACGTSGGGLLHMEAVPQEVSLTIGTSSSSEGKRNHAAMQTSLTAMRRSHGSLKCVEGLSSFASSTNASHPQHQQLVASSSSYSTGTSKSIKERQHRSSPSSNNTESGFPCSNHKGHFPFYSSQRRDSDLIKDAPPSPNRAASSREMHTQTENNNEPQIEVINMNTQPQSQQWEQWEPPSQTSPFGELSRFSEPTRRTHPLSAESPSLHTTEHTQGPDFQLASGPASCLGPLEDDVSPAQSLISGAVFIDSQLGSALSTGRGSPNFRPSEGSLYTVSAMSIAPPEGEGGGGGGGGYIDIPVFSSGGIAPSSQRISGGGQQGTDWASATSSFRKGPLSSVSYSQDAGIASRLTSPVSGGAAGWPFRVNSGGANSPSFVVLSAPSISQSGHGTPQSGTGGSSSARLSEEMAFANSNPDLQEMPGNASHNH